MDSPIKVSITIPTMNRLEFLQKSIESVRQGCTGISHEIIVVYAPCQDGTLEFLKAQKDILSVPEGPQKGATAAYDKGMRLGRGEYVGWLNDDSKYEEGAITNMIEFLDQNPEVGLGAFYFNGNDLDKPFEEPKIRYVFGVPYANFGMGRKTVLEQVGYADLQFKKYGWDPDLSLKVWSAGHQVRGCSKSKVWHFCPEDDIKASGRALVDEDTKVLHGKWLKKINDLLKRISPRWEDMRFYKREAALPHLKHWYKVHVAYLVDNKKMEEALSVSDEVIALDNRDPGPRYQKAGILKSIGKLDSSLLMYQSILADGSFELPPSLAGGVHFHLGDILYRQNKPNLAREHLSKCLEFIPGHEMAKKILTQCPEGKR